MSDDLILNDSQMEAVMATEGSVRLIAGAGSGKTRTLAARYAFLAEQIGILPSNILCITFTNKAAAEMRKRIRDVIGDDEGSFICTFHGLCNSILLEESHVFHYPKSFMVMDAADVDDLLALIYEERGLTSRDMTFSKARDLLEMKKTVEHPEYTEDLIALDARKLYERYERAKEVEDILFYGYLYHQKKSFALDYNDLIALTLKILRENPQTAQKWLRRFEYIMVDEFQDIDPQQYELLEVLRKGHGNLFIVGDPDQTIYTWRGANVKYLLEFDKVFAPCRTFFLNENYRSTPSILNAANHLIDQNHHRIKKELFTQNLPGAPVYAGSFQDAHDEAAGVVSRIEKLLHKGYELKDIAILYRAHYLSRPLEDALMEAEIPYAVYSGVPFFSRMEIKDAISYARMILYQDDLDFLRTVNKPKRQIGKTRIRFLQDYAREHEVSLFQALIDNAHTERFANTKAHEYIDLITGYDQSGKSITRILDEILRDSGYEGMLRLEGAQERLDNLAELKQAASEYEISWGEETSLESWLRHVALMSSSDRELESQRVRLMTIHTAKGLEFECVFLIGLNEGIFPSRQTKNAAALEEERRLAFVAVTRAKKELMVSEAAGLMHSGSSRLPSRFLFDLDDGSVQWNPPMAQDRRQSAARLIAMKTRLLPGDALERLEPGDLVEHAVFGPGIVLESDGEQGTMVVQFDKLATRRTLSMKAKMKKTGHQPLESVLH